MSNRGLVDILGPNHSWVTVTESAYGTQVGRGSVQETYGVQVNLPCMRGFLSCWHSQSATNCWFWPQQRSGFIWLDSGFYDSGISKRPALENKLIIWLGLGKPHAQKSVALTKVSLRQQLPGTGCKLEFYCPFFEPLFIQQKELTDLHWRPGRRGFSFWGSSFLYDCVSPYLLWMLFIK